MKLKTKGWVSLFIYLLSIWVNSVLLTLSKSFGAVARGWRMFLDFFPPFLYCSHFFSSQALRKDTQTFVLNLCFTHIPFSVCSRSRTIAWQLSTLLIVWQGQWNLLGPAASVVPASQLESHSSPLTPHLIQITRSGAVAATRGTVGDEQQHPCSQWSRKVQLSCYLFHEAFPFSPRIFSDYNCVSWQQVQTVAFILHLSYAI